MRLSAWLLVTFLGIGSIPAWAATDHQTPSAQVDQPQQAQQPQPVPQPQVSPRGENSFQAFKQMGPAMGSMVESMMSAMLKFYGQPETANAIATFTRNYYEALVKHGFTEEQALKIVSNVGIPTMSGR